ncbi:YggT family protein [Pseudoclavibacter endophyticus]|uniref:YggT family protein n=1 Tax=Pseudoclavibacter endophyticus TaxID=1778590 RepID=A0A6H9WU92_9MICO|nr:YggT family protein [Pseudoclavibacter endophyticus]KAB1650245.1 YggT family protein [Pseudoclavibacter endophyticus]GGA55869.1 YggT family protein [Pseudoclavibacter endophyticus]
MLQIVGALLGFVIGLYIFVMWGRLILDYVQLFARTWRPKGVVLLLCELVYTLTDPPLKFVRRFVPPLRLGNIAIDLAWLIVMFALIILSNLVIFIR